MSAIEPHTDVHVFFRDKLSAAMKRCDLYAREATEFYLVQLLSDFVASTPQDILSKPLAERLGRALTASGAEALRRFKQLGDLALFVSGFFADHLDSRGVSRRYVSDLGGQAYAAAGGLACRSRGSAVARDPEVYAELSDRFDAFAGVLNDVREDTTLRTPRDVLRLYERWRRTGSPLLARRLRAEGVFPQVANHEAGTLH